MTHLTRQRIAATHKSILAKTGLLLAGLLATSFPALAQNALDPFKILTNSDLSGLCDPQDADTATVNYAGCCGSPGRRQCIITTFYTAGTAPACLNPPSTKSAIESYSQSQLCTMPSPSLDPALGAVLSRLSAPTTQPDFTFYVTSDIHYFRNTFNLTDQISHVGAINNFSQGNPKWPTGTGVPANTPINTPSVVIIDGDITTHGYANDLGAFRTMYEENTLPGSLRYPFMLGLGNHETISNESSSDAHRMYDYLHAKMADSNIHMDQASGNYSWDWQGVHMLQLNTWAGDQTSLYVHSSDGLTWLQSDLQRYVGNTATPVMIFQHYGVNSVDDTNKDWPRDSQAVDATKTPTGRGYETFWRIISPYNVIGLFSGHDHCLGSRLLYDDTPNSQVTGYTFHGIPGYGLPVDNFDDGSGGDTSGSSGAHAGLGNKCASTFPPQNGTGSFLTTRVTKNYLDVAAVSWTSNGTPNGGTYFDNGIGFPSGQSVCRKRINSQFAKITSGIPVVAVPGGYKVTNNTIYHLSIPLALQFGPTDGDTNYDFVDTCSGAPHSYVLVNGEAGIDPGVSVTVPVAFNPSNVPTPSVVALTPLSDAVPNSFNFVTAFATSDQKAVAPATQSITIHGAANQAYTAAPVFITSTKNWMTVSPSSGTFDQFGFAILSLQFVTGNLQNTTEGNVFGMVQVTTTKTGTVVSVPVEITFKAAIPLTLTASLPDWFNPNSGANAEFTATFSNPNPIVDNSSGDPLAVTGIVSLRTQTLDPVSGLVTSSNVLSNAIVNSSGDNCGAQNPANNSVVFGGTGLTNDYCPSNIGSGQNTGSWKFSMPPGLYYLAAYYEGIAAGTGDSAYAPVVSPTMPYRVGDPLTGISISSGNSQATPVSAYFGQPLAIQVFARTSLLGGPANAPVIFTVIPGGNGASGIFANGKTTITVMSDVNGIALTPPVIANGIQGTWGIQAAVAQSTPLLVTATFNLTNGPAQASPIVTTTITGKTGSANARTWTFSFKDTSTVAAGNLTLAQLTVAPVAGFNCSPLIKSGVPSSIPVLPAAGAGTLNVLIDFSSCPANARFSVTPSVTASGVAQTPVVIGNQFQ